MINIIKRRLITIVNAESVGSESITANTIFHGMKMPVLKVFHMIFRLTAKKKVFNKGQLGSLNGRFRQMTIMLV